MKISVILSVRKSLEILRKTYAQLAFLWLVYFILIIVCYFFVSGVVRELLAKSADDMLANMEARVAADFLESETAIRSASLGISRMLAGGGKPAEVLSYMKDFTKTVLSDDRRLAGATGGLYGVFDAFGGAFLDGSGWEAPAMYSPKGRPWYGAALSAKGAPASTEPYVDAERGEWVITYSQQITNAKGKSSAVIGLDMPLRKLRKYFLEARLAEGGSGIMTDADFNIIIGPDEQTTGQHVSTLKSPDIYRILSLLNKGEELRGYKTVNNRRDGETIVVHTRSLKNGWHIGILTPVRKYYSDLFDKALFIIVLGTLLNLVLSLIVLRIAAAKMSADEKDRRKSNFLANMSHEIRTPMNAIIGFAELALREDIPPAAYEHIFTIKQAGANLLSIINDILDFSKIESGKLEIIPANYLFSSLVNDVVSIIKMRATYSRLRFVVNIDSNIPNALTGDETRVRQVMLNLLSNAVKYTDKGHVALDVTCEIGEEDTVTLHIEVTDTGKGIKKDDMSKLFKDFAQVDKAKNRGIEGTGLGLAITHNVLKAMGGTITVTSEYGKGSRFAVALPQKFTGAEKLAHVEDSARKKVIIYERREVYSNSVVRTIENLGVNCTLVASGFEFDEKTAGNAYDFIFIAPALYESVKNIIVKRAADAKVVLLTEFGDAIADRNVTILSMPVYSINVANILNGAADNLDYGRKKESFARFTAPEADILVVDDTNTNLRVAEGLLAPYKVRVSLCKSGPEAIEAVQNKRYDIVFMDHMMPGMDGIEATQRIRDISTAFRTLPIVALTANAVAGAKEMFLSEGFNDFLSKPIDVGKLNAVLEKWIAPEKRKSPTETNGSPAQPGDDGGIGGISIDGVDIEKGVALSGGQGAHYLRTISMFYEDGFEKIEEIKKCLDAGDLHLYATHVHGLKSASASIGADKISTEAKALESAGKNNNTTYIQSHNPGFLMDLETLLRGIGKALDKLNRQDETENSGQDFEELRAELVKLRAALDGFDSAAIDEAANTLQKYARHKEFGAAAKSISQNVLIGEYDEAVAQIDELLKETALKETGVFEM